MSGTPSRPCVLSRAAYRRSLLASRLDSRAFLAVAPFVDELTVIASSADGRFYRESQGNLSVYLLPSAPGRLATMTFAALGVPLALALKARGRATHFVAGDPFMAGLVALVAARVARCPFIVMAQGEVLSLPKERFDRATLWSAHGIATAVCKRADRVRAVSERIRDQLVAAGVKPERIVVVPSRCDVKEFDPGRFSGELEAGRADLGYGPDDEVVIMVGALNTSKGVEVAIAAISQVRERRRNIRLLLVGDGELREELTAQVQAANLGDVVRFHGRVGHQDVPRLLALADAYLLASLDEGLPRAVLEAMAMGVPVVVTDVGGNPDVVRDGFNGRLVKARDPGAIARALEEVLSDRQKGRELGSAGRATIVERYNFDAQIENLAREAFLLG